MERPHCEWRGNVKDRCSTICQTLSRGQRRYGVKEESKGAGSHLAWGRSEWRVLVAQFSNRNGRNQVSVSRWVIYLEEWRGSLALRSLRLQSFGPLDQYTTSPLGQKPEDDASWSPRYGDHCTQTRWPAGGCRRCASSIWRERENGTVLLLQLYLFSRSFTHDYVSP